MMSIRSRLSPRLAVLALATGLGLGSALACFDGFDAFGLPCEEDSQCGTLWLCEDNYCGGEVLCGDGSTVDASRACDGTQDCDDGIDEDPERCGTDGVTDDLCAAVDDAKQACEAVYGADANECSPFDAADELCEDDMLGDPCMAVIALDTACEMLFGDGAPQCAGFAEVEDACGGGDGDGDGDPTGDGDGDPTTTTGDGDGDPTTTTGDGDGDPTTTTGDGDGDTDFCAPDDNDSSCQTCTKMQCCEEYTACMQDSNCICFDDCLAGAGDIVSCTVMCGVQTPETMAVLDCGAALCQAEC